MLLIIQNAHIAIIELTNYAYVDFGFKGRVNRLSIFSTRLGILKKGKDSHEPGYSFFGVSYFGFNHMVMQQNKERIKVINNTNSNEAFAYHLLNTFSECFDQYHQDKMNEEQWNSWKIWMKLAFQHQTLVKIWTGDSSLKSYFKPEFQKFIEKEVIALTLYTN